MLLCKQELIEIIKSEIGNTAEEMLQRFIRMTQVASVGAVLDQLAVGSDREQLASRELQQAISLFTETIAAPERKAVDVLAERIAAAVEKAEDEAGNCDDDDGDGDDETDDDESSHSGDSGDEF